MTASALSFVCTTRKGRAYVCHSYPLRIMDNVIIQLSVRRQTVPNVLDGREVLIIRPHRLHNRLQFLRKLVPICGHNM